MRALKIILVLWMSWLPLWALEQGEVTFFVFKSGKPLSNVAITIDGTVTGTTDADGAWFRTLDVGTHQAVINVYDGQTLTAHAKKSFIVAPDQNTEIIITLEETGAVDVALEATQDAAQFADANASQSNATRLKGRLHAVLVSKNDHTPVANAHVFVKSSTLQAKSDDQGAVMLELPEGNHTLTVVHDKFSNKTMSVSIQADVEHNQRIELSPAGMELEEFVVLVPHVEGSLASTVAEEKNSEAIANIIGSAQMAKQGDSNAAAALKRVPGITIIGGKTIYVRGLGDRYSSTELNGMPLPSPDPIKRTVPMDMFPAGVIRSLQVQKTFSPDITGAFGGGYVNVRTKQNVEEDYVSFGLGISAHDSVGSEVAGAKGSIGDFSGIDFGYRKLGTKFIDLHLPTIGSEPTTLQYSKSDMSTLLSKRSINQLSKTVMPGGTMQFELGKIWDLGNGHELDMLFNYGYRTETNARLYRSYDYVISKDGVQVTTPDNIADNNVYNTTYQQGGTFALGYAYKELELHYVKFLVLNTLSQVRDINGTFGENNSKEHRTLIEWQQRLLNNDQFAGTYDYHAWLEHKLDFGMQYASAREYVPSDVEYDYRMLTTSSVYQFVANQSRLSYNYRDTQDRLFSMYAKNHTMTPLFSSDDYVEVGGVYERKKREGRNLAINISTTVTLDNPIDEVLTYRNGDALIYQLDAGVQKQYDALIDRKAVYLKGLAKPFESFEVVYGARYVGLLQSVDQFKTTNNIVGIENTSLDIDKVLPSVSVKFAPTDTHQFRLAYSQTFITPDLREFVNSEFLHPVFFAKISGNPALVETDIYSYDARYDYYFDKTDSINVAFFYKMMQNPIEDTRAFTSGTIPRFSFDNSKSATLSGAELSWHKKFDFLGSWFERIIFFGNYTYINSAVTLTPEQQAKFVTQERGLQGLSPQTLNLALSYDDGEARSINVSYNKMSERLMRVALKNGDVVLGLDDYEEPPHLLDFTWIEKIDVPSWDTTVNATFKVGNLLDSPTVWKQGDLVTLEYKTGRTYSFSLGASF